MAATMPDDELLRCSIAAPLKALIRRGIAMRPAESLLLRLEGGAFRTRSVRELLREMFDVEVGAYTYGACLQLGVFERGLRVGRYVSMAKNVRWGLNHRLTEPFLHPVFYRPVFGVVTEHREPAATLEICADAWIGDYVVITPGCSRIGYGAVVGAGSVVTRDVPDYTVVVGVPARPMRLRFSEPVCDALLRSRWWERRVDELRTLEDIAALDIRSEAAERQVISAMQRLARQQGPVGGMPNANGAEFVRLGRG